MSITYEKSNRVSWRENIDKRNNKLSNVKVIVDPDKSCFMARVKSLLYIHKDFFVKYIFLYIYMCLYMEYVFVYVNNRQCNVLLQ